MDQTSGEKVKILLVEDNETYRKVLANALRVSGFEVTEAADGQQGLTKARENPPQLALVDVYMPIMDGLTMLGEFKKDEILMKIPVVMLTNVQEELERAVKNGAEEAILKSSLTPHQVIDVCKKYLNQNTMSSPA